MDTAKENEETFREACCYGDLEAIKLLMRQGVDINSQHSINGRSGLHWACKRGHAEVVQFLVSNGADLNLVDSHQQLASDLCSSVEIKKILGKNPKEEVEEQQQPINGPNEERPFTPNYLASPPLVNKVEVAGGPSGSLHKDISGLKDSCTSPLRLPHRSLSSLYYNGFTPTATQEKALPASPKEIVLKVRIAECEDPDFIEIEMPAAELTFRGLLTTSCQELSVNPQLVERIRKLPNTRLRNDRDVKRLSNFEEIELVVKGLSRTNKASASSSQGNSKNAYQSISNFKNQTILY